MQTPPRDQVYQTAGPRSCYANHRACIWLQSLLLHDVKAYVCEECVLDYSRHARAGPGSPTEHYASHGRLRMTGPVPHSPRDRVTQLESRAKAGLPRRCLWLYIPLCRATEPREQTRSAFRSCYRNRCLLTGKSTNAMASHVGTLLRHTAQGSRPRGAREGCVADGG